MNEMEYKICGVLNWNFDNIQTYILWAQWFMQRWDDYVDESLSYLKQQFHLKFYDKVKQSHSKYFTMINFVDIIAISYESKKYTPRQILACVMYLIIGGKEIMHAFQVEYSEMFTHFQDNLPIDQQGQNDQGRLPEGILFYNQII
jgi:hypothetical protein